MDGSLKKNPNSSKFFFLRVTGMITDEHSINMYPSELNVKYPALGRTESIYCQVC